MSNTSQIQLRHLFKVYSGSTPESGKRFYWNGDIFWVTPEDVSALSDGYRLDDTKRKITEEGYENSGLKMVPKNSIVLTKRAPIGLLAILSVEACSNQGCFLLVPKEEVVPQFYYYYLLANKEYLQILGRGSTFMELSQDDLKPLKVPHIPKEKQHIIAEFLDKETKRITDLIKEKESQLNLLSEKREALITQTVTKGISSKVKLKHSGFDWVGKIPEHWIIIRLKYLSDIFYGLSQPPKYIHEGTALIRATNVYRGTIKDEGLVFIDETQLETGKPVKLNIGDIIVVRSGAYTGDSAIVTEEWENAIAGFDMIIRPNKKIIPKFLATILLSSYVLNNQLLPLRVRAAQPHLNSEELGSVTVFLPALDEQQEILKFLSIETDKIDALGNATKASIKLLKERRSTIITAAVTGDIQIPS
ncbi:MAG: restriction endonuclease subunit S [Ginsengibacter sp.]